MKKRFVKEKQLQQSGLKKSIFSLTGRSMIEMLGVLAIIGVLSIGGLYAYRQAMLSHRINQTKDWVNRMKLTVADICVYSEKCPFSMYVDVDSAKNREILCQNAGADFCNSSMQSYVYHPYLSTSRWGMAVIPYSNYFNLVLFFFDPSESLCRALVNTQWSGLSQLEVGAPYDVQPDGSFLDEDKEKMLARCATIKETHLGRIRFTFRFDK